MAGFFAGGVLGAAAAIMSAPGYRSMVAKKIKLRGKKALRWARQWFLV